MHIIIVPVPFVSRALIIYPRIFSYYLRVLSLFPHFRTSTSFARSPLIPLPSFLSYTLTKKYRPTFTSKQNDTIDESIWYFAVVPVFSHPIVTYATTATTVVIVCRCWQLTDSHDYKPKRNIVTRWADIYFFGENVRTSPFPSYIHTYLPLPSPSLYVPLHLTMKSHKLPQRYLKA